MTYKRLGVLASFVVCLASGSVCAETVSCPGTTHHVQILTNDRYKKRDGSFYSNVAEEEDIWIDGDDDRPVHHEWNNLTPPEQKTPSEIVCYKSEDEISVRIELPFSIHRCILDKGVFSCQSGTVSCPGYAGRVYLLAKGEDGQTRAVAPDQVSQEEEIWRIDRIRLGRPKNVHVMAYCPFVVEIGPVEHINIPARMKECRLLDKRFICTQTPDKHDLFWPDVREGKSR